MNIHAHSRTKLTKISVRRVLISITSSACSSSDYGIVMQRGPGGNEGNLCASDPAHFHCRTGCRELYALNDCFGRTETFRSTLALGRMRPLGEVHHREGPMQTRRTFQSASKASRPGYRSTLQSFSASRIPESASGQTSILDGQHANPGRTTRHSEVADMQTRRHFGASASTP